jgi:hypothetical protein
MRNRTLLSPRFDSHRYPVLHIAKNKVQTKRSYGKETDLAIEFGKTRLTETLKSLAFLAKSLP